MKPDPGIQPTREVRTRISREHGNDLRRLGDYYMEYQRRFADRLRWAQETGKVKRDQVTK
jgi:hypothetical protein